MTERPVTETGIFSRSGFSNPQRAFELINTLDVEIDQDLLVENLSQVADPDNALLLLVRICDKKNMDFTKVLRDSQARLRLLQVLGSSNGLGEHLVSYPEDASTLLGETSISRAYSKEE